MCFHFKGVYSSILCWQEGPSLLWYALISHTFFIKIPLDPIFGWSHSVHIWHLYAAWHRIWNKMLPGCTFTVGADGRRPCFQGKCLDVKTDRLFPRRGVVRFPRSNRRNGANKTSAGDFRCYLIDIWPLFDGNHQRDVPGEGNARLKRKNKKRIFFFDGFKWDGGRALTGTCRMNFGWYRFTVSVHLRINAAKPVGRSFTVRLLNLLKTWSWPQDPEDTRTKKQMKVDVKEIWFTISRK